LIRIPEHGAVRVPYRDTHRLWCFGLEASCRCSISGLDRPSATQRNSIVLYCIVLDRRLRQWAWFPLVPTLPRSLTDRDRAILREAFVAYGNLDGDGRAGLGWAGLGWAVRYVPCLLGTVFSTVFHPFTTPGSSCSPPRLSSTYVLVAVVVRFPCCCKNASTGAIP